MEGEELPVPVSDEEVVDAFLSELVQGHHSEEGCNKGQQQHYSVRTTPLPLPSSIVTLAGVCFHCHLLCLQTFPRKCRQKKKRKESKLVTLPQFLLWVYAALTEKTLCFSCEIGSAPKWSALLTLSLCEQGG